MNTRPPPPPPPPPSRPSFMRLSEYKEPVGDKLGSAMGIFPNTHRQWTETASIDSEKMRKLTLVNTVYRRYLQLQNQCNSTRHSSKLGCFRHVRNSNIDEGSRSHTRFAECSTRVQVKTSPSQNVPELVKRPQKRKKWSNRPNKTSPFSKRAFSKKYGIVKWVVLMYGSLK